MKYLSISILALISGTSALKLESSFLDGDFDEDNEFVHQMIDMPAQDAEKMYQKTLEHAPPTDYKVGVQADIRQGSQMMAQSDPIFGSLGNMDQDKFRPTNEASKLEWDLSHRVPQNYTLDPNTGPSTMGSIAWAELKTGFKMSEPPKYNKTKALMDEKESFDYDQDSEVNNTMDSIKWAENAYNINNTDQYHNDNGNNQYGWNGGQRAERRDWWNFLMKDQFDGMRSMGRDMSAAVLDQAGVSNSSDIHERWTEYERILGAKVASGKMTDEDRDYARKLKEHLYGKYDKNDVSGDVIVKKIDPPPKAKARFQLTPEEMAAAKRSMDIAMGIISADEPEVVEEKPKTEEAGGFVPPELAGMMGGIVAAQGAPVQAGASMIPAEITQNSGMAQQSQEARPVFNVAYPPQAAPQQVQAQAPVQATVPVAAPMPAPVQVSQKAQEPVVTSMMIEGEMIKVGEMQMGHDDDLQTLDDNIDLQIDTFAESSNQDYLEQLMREQ